MSQKLASAILPEGYEYKCLFLSPHYLHSKTGLLMDVRFGCRRGKIRLAGVDPQIHCKVCRLYESREEDDG